MGFNLFGSNSAPTVNTTGLNQGLAGAGAGAQWSATGMAQQAAQGGAPTAADAQMRAGLLQAQQAAQAGAVSTRGNFGLAGAQRSAQATQSGMAQNAVNQAAQLRAQEQSQAMAQYIQAAQAQRSAELQGAGLSLQAAQSQAQLEAQQNQMNQQSSMQLLGMGLGAATGVASGGAMFSDERLKQLHMPLHGGGDTSAAEQFLASLRPETFTWKDPRSAPNPEAADRPNLGVLAQDVEQSPWGKAIVQQDPNTGYKTLDHHALLSATAAGMGALKQAKDDHEARLKALESLVGGQAR